MDCEPFKSGRRVQSKKRRQRKLESKKKKSAIASVKKFVNAQKAVQKHHKKTLDKILSKQLPLLGHFVGKVDFGFGNYRGQAVIFYSNEMVERVGLTKIMHGVACF